jgi:hypothetical protein
MNPLASLVYQAFCHQVLCHQVLCHQVLCRLVIKFFVIKFFVIKFFVIKFFVIKFSVFAKYSKTRAVRRAAPAVWLFGCSAVTENPPRGSRAGNPRTGIQEYPWGGYRKIQEYRNTGIQEYRNTGRAL